MNPKLTPKELEQTFIGLIAHELPHARKDDARMAALIEMQATALALTISVKAQGNGAAADTLIQVAEGYIVKEVTRLTPRLAKIYKEAKF